MQVGFYTQVLGLGRSPDDVAITGAVRSKARWMNEQRHLQFLALRREPLRDAHAGRKRQHLGGLPGHGPAPVHVKGDLNLWDGGWSSGGFIADCKIDGQVNSGSQQQWFSRNAEWGSWKGGTGTWCSSAPSIRRRGPGRTRRTR